jgi:hypothetical protein
MKGHPIPYSAEERAWLQANCTLPAEEYHARFCERFQRSDVTAQNLHAMRKRCGWRTGRTGRFEKGMIPANKGKPMPFHPNSAATRFKSGQRTGRANALYRPVGSERVSKDGYIERKVHDGLPMRSRWQAVHRLNWIAANGPIPAGFGLKCLDGNKQNTDPSNWELLPRAVLARLNGGRHGQRLAYDQAAPEAKPIVLAIAKLQHAVVEKRR